jgi:hypothetical protein
MSSDGRGRADALMRLALIAAPPERRDWAEAMRAEVAHLPDSSAQSFALGCLWATIRARAGSPAFILAATQCLLVLGAIGWSAGNLWLAGRLASAGAPLPATVAYASAAIYAAGALLTALLGLRATTVLATPMLVLVGLVAAGAGILLPASPHNPLYQALALEQCGLLATVLLIAGGVPAWVAAQEGGKRNGS